MCGRAVQEEEKSKIEKGSGKKNCNKIRECRIFTIGIVLMCISFFASLSIGKYPITIQDLAAFFLGQGLDGMDGQVLSFLRIPRTIMVLLAGAGLGISGAVYQSIFRNPLASPDLIGVTSGANAGAAFAVICLNGGMAAAAGAAFLGGILAVWCAVMFAGITRKRSSADFVLAGIAVKALADAFVMGMKYLADPEKQLASIDYWLMGGFSQITLDELMTAGPVILCGILGLTFFRWPINLLMLDEDEARALGLAVGRVRGAVLAITTLVVAATVSVTGSIAFIGLMAPHIARLLIRRNDFNFCVLSGILGSCILLAADCLARSIAASEIPISILTSAIGVPVMIWLLYRKEFV